MEQLPCRILPLTVPEGKRALEGPTLTVQWSGPKVTQVFLLTPLWPALVIWPSADHRGTGKGHPVILPEICSDSTNGEWHARQQNSFKLLEERQDDLESTSFLILMILTREQVFQPLPPPCTQTDSCTLHPELPKERRPRRGDLCHPSIPPFSAITEQPWQLQSFCL